MKRTAIGGGFVTLLTTSLFSAGLLAGGSPAGATDDVSDKTQPAAAVTLASTIALDNCSASLVRFPTSVETDPALMLTNGHCFEGGMPGPGEVVQDEPSSRSGDLLDAEGNSLGEVTADTALYSTMTDTDVTLYQLTDTFAAIEEGLGATAMTLATAQPADATAMGVPSGYHHRVWNCSVNGITDLREAEWSFTDSIRYDADCDTIPGSSGSPIVSEESGEVIGINNTGNEDGEMCTLNNPCEVAEDGTTSAHQGQSYGQQTWWITTCVNGDRQLDLTVAGCALPGAGATGLRPAA